MPVLRTKRLILRPICVTDGDALHSFWTDPSIRKYLWDNEVISLDMVMQIIRDSEVCFREVGSGLFAIEVAEHPDRLVGFCGHRRMAPSADTGGEPGGDMELLYGILPRYWGEGMVTEAANEVLRHGFQSCGLRRVIGATDTPNQRSVRVMQRLGMVFEERRQHKGLDTVFYSLSLQEFARSK